MKRWKNPFLFSVGVNCISWCHNNVNVTKRLQMDNFPNFRKAFVTEYHFLKLIYIYDLTKLASQFEIYNWKKKWTWNVNDVNGIVVYWPWSTLTTHVTLEVCRRHLAIRRGIWNIISLGYNWCIFSRAFLFCFNTSRQQAQYWYTGWSVTATL